MRARVRFSQDAAAQDFNARWRQRGRCDSAARRVPRLSQGKLFVVVKIIGV
jgi:hypothetical protein